MKQLKAIGIILLFAAVLGRVERKSNKFLSKAKTGLNSDYYIEVRTKTWDGSYVECRLNTNYLDTSNNNAFATLGLPLYSCKSDPASGKTYQKKDGNTQYYIFLWKYFKKDGTWCAYNPSGNGKYIWNNGVDSGCGNDSNGAFFFRFYYEGWTSSCIDYDNEIKVQIIGRIKSRQSGWYDRVKGYKDTCTSQGSTYVTQKALSDSTDTNYDTQITAKNKCVTDGNTALTTLKATYTTTSASISTKNNEIQALNSQKSAKDTTVSQYASLIEKTTSSNTSLQAQADSGKADSSAYQTAVDQAKAAFDAAMDSLVAALESESDVATAAKTAVTGGSSPDLTTFNTKMALILPAASADSGSNSSRRLKF
jgi:hypothetical protein